MRFLRLTSYVSWEAWWADSTAAMIIKILTVTIPLLTLLICAGTRLSFPGEIARIEQLRADVSKVDPKNGEDVIGQVTHWNQVIASNKRYNQIWWADPFIPDAWNSVEFIQIPQ